MTNRLHAFEALEYLQWRGITLPVSDWEHRFAHEKAEHHIIYRAGVAIDQMGAQGRTFQYVLPLKQGVAKAPYHDAFTSIYFKLYWAFQDKSPGTLIDPVHGVINAVPGEWNAQASANSDMDGPTVRVTFIEDTDVDAATKDKVPTFSSLERSAVSLDDAVAVIPWDRPVPIPKTSDPLSIASGVLQQGSRAIEKTQAYSMAVANRAGEVEEACEDLDRRGIPGTNGTRLAARKLRVDSTRLMDLADMLRMNAQIAKNPIIAPGTSIFVTRKRRRNR
jgi:hypothetical protein